MTWSAHQVVKVVHKVPCVNEKCNCARIYMHVGFYIFIVEDQSAYSMLCSTLKVSIIIKCDWSCLQGKTCVMVYGNGFA